MRAEQPARPGGYYWTRVPPALSRRVRAFLGQHGQRRTIEMLQVSPCTLAELREEGRLKMVVQARVEARLAEFGG